MFKKSILATTVAFALIATGSAYAKSDLSTATTVKKENIIFNKNFPVETQTFYSPVPVKGADGRNYLLYEVHLTYVPALTQAPIVLQQVEVLDKDTNKVLANYQGKTLEGLIRQLGKLTTAKDKEIMKPGSRIVVYPFVVLPADAEMPKRLSHKFIFSDAADKNKLIELVSDTVNVSNIKPEIIASPLKGDGWLVSDGLGIENHHRNDIITTEGRTRVPQRFAVDWIKVDAEGSPTKPGTDPNKNDSFYCYGEKVYAVADGVVASVSDELSDNAPVGSIIKKAQSIEHAAGNVVGVEMGRGSYGFYCHLQPNSIKLKVGDHVKKGDVIGLLGNSGNSTAPHLHFHIVDKNNVLGAEGIPYVFDKFTVQMTPEQTGQAIEKINKGKKITVPSGGTVHHDELPLMDSVVSFPKE